MDDDKLSFEEAMAQLETIVRSLENGKIKLEEAVTAYTQGARLLKVCEKKLEDARLKVEKIKLSADGQPQDVEPFDDPF